MTCDKCCIHSGVTKYKDECCPFYKTESDADMDNAAWIRKQEAYERMKAALLSEGKEW